MISIINTLKETNSFIYKELKIKGFSAKLFFLEAGYDSTRLESFIFYLEHMDIEIKHLDKIFVGTCEKIISPNINFCIKNLSEGKILAFFEEIETTYIINVNKIEKRSISPSELDPVNLFGSKESFIENLKINYTLIAKRIKSKDLSYNDFDIGSVTQTTVRMIYIQGFVKKSVINKIEEKLKSINIKGIKTIGDITSIFNKDNYLPLVQITSSIESTQNYLLNGRVVILIDNFPVCLVLPVTIDIFTNLPDEASSPKYYLIYTRGLTYILYFVSVFLLGIYIMMINYHSNCLSLQVISEVKTASKGSTLPLIGEIIFIIFIFEFLRIASSKTPSSNIQNLVITVGGLIIGQNTVSSGFVSPFNLVLTALCYLATYGVTNNKHLIIGLSFQRFFILLASYFFGLIGFISSSAIIINYMNSISSLGVKYLSPLSFKGFKEMLNTKIKEKTLLTIRRR